MDEYEMIQQQMNHEAAVAMGRTNYMNQSQNDINSLLSELTNPEPLIIDIEMSLKGKQLNEKGEYITVSRPLMNDEGVAHMVRLIRTMVSRVMNVSNLTEEQVKNLTKELGRVICRDLTTNKDKYGVNDKDRTAIVSLIIYPCYEAANSALENGFRRFLKSGIIETTINTQGQPMKQGKGGGGALSWLGIGRK